MKINCNGVDSSQRYGNMLPIGSLDQERIPCCHSFINWQLQGFQQSFFFVGKTIVIKQVMPYEKMQWKFTKSSLPKRSHTSLKCHFLGVWKWIRRILYLTFYYINTGNLITKYLVQNKSDRWLIIQVWCKDNLQIQVYI